MEEKKESPSEINSFYVIPKLQTTHFDLNKKRKLPAEQLGLPLPKHKHYNVNFPHGGLPETQCMNVHLLKGNTDGMCFDKGSESGTESAKDSNSFNEESDSATSVFGGVKIESDQAMTCTYDSSSTQSFRYGVGSSETSQSYLESSTAMEASSTIQEVKFVSRDGDLPHHDERLHSVHNLEEHLLELGNEAYNCAEYGNKNTEQCTDQELEDLLHSNGLNPNIYVLSSGRWSVNQEAQSGTKNPTIDQEFEQYFSTLML